MKRYTPSIFCSLFAMSLLFLLPSCKEKKVAETPGDGAGEQSVPVAPAHSMLSADELLELCTYPDAAALQLFMKERQQIFMYARKGEYISMAQGTVMDTSGKPIPLPMSTLYFASDPGSTWRIAQTVHTDSLKNVLLQDFKDKGYALQDSIKYYATNGKAYRYQSPQYPGRILYYSPTMEPWNRKGIYLGATWRSHVFEINIIHE
ncbi:MAG: hypothetical protein IPP99_10155 [Chitinophagaceae bacterium]|nr:hypothetical protein [Chitinophagaceae bacterium]